MFLTLLLLAWAGAIAANPALLTLVSQVDITNLFSLQVTGNGSPGFSATNNFTSIVLNPGCSVALCFLGDPNSTNVIQATASLSASSVWRNVATNATQFYRSYALLQ